MASYTNGAAGNRGRHHARPPQQTGPALSIAALAMGILAIPAGLRVHWLLAIVAGVAAIALGAVAIRQRAQQRPLAIAGMALGVLNIAVYVALVAMIAYNFHQFTLLMQ
ncbi:hypothetical protein [Enorma phocaeensis]|uniref:DUF4190 domain-containing protein n=1 Tax=Enorma phocaeensis TaxID=1871019 RepID=A0ABT7V950_9ACTN|nr:hypothetical protein [Enorma phocaeensis]MDM8275028.1 hypothetical protein [Enorma phocaeensis]